MSLQTRLTSMITAIGADIKALQTGKANSTHTHVASDITGTTPAVKSATPPSDTSWIWVDTSGI